MWLSLAGIVSKRLGQSSWFHGTEPVEHCVIRKFGYLQNYESLFHSTSIVASFCQPSLTQVDAQCDKLVTIIGQLSWQYLQRSTFVRRPWPVDDTERPCLCTARRARSSASRGSICDCWYLYWAYLRRRPDLLCGSSRRRQCFHQSRLISSSTLLSVYN